jgi:surface polysaccharide O-acyltransferase-like enzyme
VGQDRRSEGASTRNQAIDLGRILLCLPVALLHAMAPPNQPGTPLAAALVATLCRCAVPFFFVANGYFLDPAPARLIRQAARRLLAFAAWLIVYLAVARALFGPPPPYSWRDLINGGPAVHLWFLPASAIALLLVGAGFARLGPVTTSLLALLLAAIALCFGSYHQALGLAALPAQRFAMGPVLIVAGWWIRQRAPSIVPGVALALTGLAWLLSIAEEAGIAAISHMPLVSHDAVASTFLLGIALFLLFRGSDEAVRRRPTIASLARFGRLSLGVYAAHLIFIWLWYRLLPAADVAASAVLAALAIVTATLAAVTIDRIPKLRWLVG